MCFAMTKMCGQLDSTQNDFRCNFSKAFAFDHGIEDEQRRAPKKCKCIHSLELPPKTKTFKGNQLVSTKMNCIQLHCSNCMVSCSDLSHMCPRNDVVQGLSCNPCCCSGIISIVNAQLSTGIVGVFGLSLGATCFVKTTANHSNHLNHHFSAKKIE